MPPKRTRLKNNDIVFEDYPEFRPNLTPREVMLAGAFGGSYFRPIKSCVGDKKMLKNQHKLYIAENIFSCTVSLTTSDALQFSIATYKNFDHMDLCF
mgnify:CR=1 FL=1